MSNPFRQQLPTDRSTPPATIVIFGASGDLTQRKLLPALYSLARDRLLPRVAIVGASRTPMTDEAFREQSRVGVEKYARKKPLDAATWSTLEPELFYQACDYEDLESMRALKSRLDAIDRARGLPGHRLFYLSTPPSAFLPIIQHLGAVGLVDPSESPWARVIIEKPFGTDLASAVKLNADVRKVLRERQIFRIDHYLGKETVQNLLVFRFGNGIFEPLWNARYVDHVQITGAETLGVEGRGAYFDHAGILRDMVQNHLMQVLALAAMEPPVSLEADAVRDEKLKVLRGLRPIDATDLASRAVRGQYGAGSVLGTAVPGYREERGVPSDSRTETFVGLKLFIDNWRWAGVPFYLRSGKRMPKRVTEIAIHFKAAPHRLFRGVQMTDVGNNVLAIRIQPDDGITLGIGTKIPGPSIEIAPVNMEFRYASSFGVEAPEAYERLLLDALAGDGTLFTRGDEVEASWQFITPLQELWAQSHEPPLVYGAGTWGPDAAHELLFADGRRWRNS